MHSARSLSLWVVLAAVTLPLSAEAQLSRLEGLKARVKEAPQDPVASLALGRAYRRAGKTKEALAELRRGASLGETARTPTLAIDVHWELSRAFVGRDEFGPAMVQCRVVAALPGGTRAGHACAAEAHLLWRRASEALVETTLALKESAPAQHGVYEAKVAEGTAYWYEGKIKEAEASLHEAAAWRPERAEAHLVLGHMYGHEQNEIWAERELREAVRLDPANAEANFELASALPPSTEAVKWLRVAVSERSGYAEAEAKLAEVELALGHVPEAHAAAEAALKDDPSNAATHLVHGRVSLVEGKLDDALKEAALALKVLPNSAQAKLLVADTQAKKGEIDLAIEAYQAAHGLDTTDPAPLVHASDECRRAGRLTSARAFGMKATQDFPAWGPGWVAYGEALEADGQPEDAKRAYESALKSKGPVDAAAIEKKIARLK